MTSYLLIGAILNFAYSKCSLGILNINSLVSTLIMPSLLLTGFLLITANWYRSSFTSILIICCCTTLGNVKFLVAPKLIIA